MTALLRAATQVEYIMEQGSVDTARIPSAVIMRRVKEANSMTTRYRRETEERVVTESSNALTLTFQVCTCSSSQCWLFNFGCISVP